jgi:hypothetical protein
MAYILIIVVTLILLHFSAPLLLGLFGDHCKLALKLMKMELEKIGISRTNSYLYENFGNLMHEGWQVDSRPSTAD